jgi:hypothetical protein
VQSHKILENILGSVGPNSILVTDSTVLRDLEVTL